MPAELNDAPIIENKSGTIKNSDFVRLHNDMAAMVVEFFKAHGLPEGADRISFCFDCLKPSVEFGRWCPMSDSSLELTDAGGNTVVMSM